MPEIHAIDLLTKETGVIIRGLTGSDNAMAIDMVNMKLYFENNNDISRANFNGTGVEVVLQNADVTKMAIDCIGRRLFWTNFFQRRIYVAALDAKWKRIITNTKKSPHDIAVDPTAG